MKRIGIFDLLIILLSCVNPLFSYNLFPSCNYIDVPSALEVFCTGANASPDAQCFKDLFEGENQGFNRLNVKLLKLTNTLNCSDDIYPIDGFFANIRELELSDASSTSFYPNLRFRYLKKFIASNGKLISLLKETFGELTSLEEIDFSRNYISRINKGTFDANPKLTVINISHNALSYLDGNTFSKLSELKILDLSFNQIEAIENDAFRNTAKLESLALEGNPLRRFDCNLFASLTNLKSLGYDLNNIAELELSGSESSFYPSGDNSDEYAIRLLQSSNELRLSKATLANLIHFSVAGKDLKSIPQIIGQLGPQLESLDVSGNELPKLSENLLVKFTKLKSLKLRNTRLSEIDSRAFYDLKNLKTLDLSENSLQNTDLMAFAAILEKLDAFYIGNSKIANIRDVLELLPSTLEELDISYNKIGKIDCFVFERFPNLRHLNLSHTSLRNFQFGTFYHQIKLETFDISYNDLRNVDFKLFARNFRQLRILNLEGNRMNELQNVIRSNFPKLEKLAISQNKISCTYLASFLSKWENLEFVRNPGKSVHIDGVSCLA